MADLLVTGGAGFIGANFVRYWTGRHPLDRIIVLDALTYAANRANIVEGKNVRFVQGDIRNTSLVGDLLDDGVDTIIHLAAETHVDRSISDPDVFVDVNIAGTHSLLKAAKASWLDGGCPRPHRFHHVSTDEVFGSLEPDDPPFSEQTPYAPNSPYSASKASSDHLVRAYHRTYGLQTTVTHCSNNYGPYQLPDKLIPLFLTNCLFGKPLPIFGDGMNVRDWLHVDDHCRGIELAVLKGRVGESYNVGGGVEHPNRAIAERICDSVDRLFADEPALASQFPNAPAARGERSVTLLSQVVDRKGHDRRYAVDISKIVGELGYKPTRGFDDGLASTIAWYIDHEAWWRPGCKANR